MKYFEYAPMLAPDGDIGGTAPAAGAAQSLEALLGSMDNQGTTGTPPPSDTPPATAPPVTPPATAPPAGETPPEDKAGAAFAAMRVQNKELATNNTAMQSVLLRMAKAMGIEGSDVNAILTKLDDDALNKLATKDNIPVELLKRLDSLEQRDKQYKEIEFRASANEGFKAIQSEFTLTDDELLKFAKDLDAAGLNPYQTAVDIKGEFVKRNLSLIVDKQVQAALARDAQGGSHSSTPGDKSGGSGGGEQPKITTQQELASLLNTLN
jgi:hypothetical protein